MVVAYEFTNFLPIPGSPDNVHIISGRCCRLDFALEIDSRYSPPLIVHFGCKLSRA